MVLGLSARKSDVLMLCRCLRDERIAIKKNQKNQDKKGKKQPTIDFSSQTHSLTHS